MKRCLLLLLCLAASANARIFMSRNQTVKEPPPLTAPTLRWANGETLTGELVEASASTLSWKTPLFEEPLVLQWSALRRIDMPQPVVSATDAFKVVLKDGSAFYGDLAGVSREAVTFRSPRHGDAVLKRSEVLSVQRIQGGGIVFGGPTGAGGWKPVGSPGQGDIPGLDTPAGRRVAQLVSGPCGSLVMPYWNRNAFLDVTLPDAVAVDFRVNSSIRPDFQIALESGSTQRLRVETWDNELVLVAANQFKSIRKIGDGERSVALRVCWDRKAHKCSVFTPEGELLVEWEVPEDRSSGSRGVLLSNKGRDLTVESLRIRAWNGQPPVKVEGNQQRVDLVDGRAVAGEIRGISGDAIQVREHGKEADTSVALKDVDAVVFSSASAQVREGEVTLSYADGAILFGKISGIKDGIAMLETTFAALPLAARLEGLRQARFQAPKPEGAPAEPPLASLDRIVAFQSTLHGTLVGDGGETPKWQAVGGAALAVPSKTTPYTIFHSLPPDAKVPAPPMLLYTSTGDVLMGTLRAIGRDGVEFESNLVEATKLPAQAVAAVQLGAMGQMSLQGFDAPGWRVVKGNDKTVRRENGTLNMEPGTSVWHPSAAQAGEIKFTLESTTAFRLRMFCADPRAAKAPSLVLWSMPDRFCCGMESSDGQINDPFQTQVEMDHPVARLVISEKYVEVYLNDTLMQKFSIPPTRRAGAGLLVEPGSLWGNSVNPVSLSHFSMSATPGCPLVPAVDGDAKIQALTVPRFRKDAPPSHVLVAANGDVLRGEIETATATHFAFRSGLEQLRVPRERVVAAVFLKKATTDAPPPEKKSRARQLLDQMIEQRMGYGGADLNILTEALQREAPDLKFKLPEPRPEQRVQIQFGGQTVGEALEQICALFDLRYRVDADDAVVLEAAGKVIPSTMARKVYWLKGGTFADGATAKDALVAKGVVFPPESAIDWNNEAGQLSVTNTPENQQKLLEVLGTDFGGSLGSPTHWLLLANGARLGLTVEKFEKESVIGSHPVYGRCRLAVADICAMRNVPPEPSEAMATLSNWRLVNAPEPVLPEAGADGSPLLGKDAKAFKIPLLEGGDFDLKKEKGKIVVLDFWASWCGPCVRSLPGLIETVSAFPADRVKLIGVNEGEAAEPVKRFIEARRWKLTVALDAGQSVGKSYGVEAIPRTVVIGSDGKVAFVKDGYSAEGEKEVADAVKKLLEAPGQ